MSLFEEAAFPFMPADPACAAQAVEVNQDWLMQASFPSDADAVIWGRLPDARPDMASLLRAAVHRESALWTLTRAAPFPLRVGGLHRLPPARLGGGALRGAARAVLRSGALVELVTPGTGTRILDAVTAAVGGRLMSGPRVGIGGAVLVRVGFADESPAVLRLARAGAPGDPQDVADTLRLLQTAGVRLAPRLHGSGRTAGASWVVEQTLPGHRPDRVSLRLARQVAAVCTRFPGAQTPPTATQAELAETASRLTERASALRRLASDVDARLRNLPSVLRHGDLWRGNLLVQRGSLSGLIDWDAGHPASVPGADLLRLVATEARLRARHSLGQGFLTRPWRCDAFATTTRGYWRAKELRPSRELLETVGIAWWATEVHGTIRRLPHRTQDEQWLAANVDRVLAALSYA